VLLPFTVVPYRLFEARYQELVRDLLGHPEEQRWIAVPRLKDGWQMNASQYEEFHHISTLGRIASWEVVGDGHYLILVEGITRCRLQEYETDTSYRMAHVKLDSDLGGGDDPRTQQVLIGELIQAVDAIIRLMGPTRNELAEVIGGLDDLEPIVYRVASHLIENADIRQELLEERHVVPRTRRLQRSLTDLVATLGRYTGRAASA
jgi:Lon protease-like protein